MGRARVFAFALLAALASLAAASDAGATLGADVASVDSNAQATTATRVVQKLVVGERHELTLPSGTVVREYVSPAGAVYAVTWRGTRVPDLRELLGPYFGQLSRQAIKGGHHGVTLTGTDFEVRSAGHGHTFAGRAWVPSLVPAGVAVDASLE
jgi:hypothetical protein